MTNWGYFLFEENKHYYIFETFSGSIKKISKSLFIKLKKDNFLENTIKEIEGFFPNNFKGFPHNEDKKCFVTLDFTNKCNLNCTYCFKTEKKYKNMNEEDIDDVLDFIETKFMPNASIYTFSVGYTTEVSLNLSFIKSLDTAILKHEKQLLDEDSFRCSPSEVYKRLPLSLQEKYPLKNDSVKTLNEILCREPLYDFYDCKNIPYVNQVLKISRKYLTARTALINRCILSNLFPDLIKEPHTVPWTISFMTNATNVTDDFINVIKGVGLESVYVSIDGPKEIHDYSRTYHNGKGSYENVEKGIKKLQEFGIKVIASTVITSKHQNLIEIIDYLKSLNMNGIEIYFIRGKQSSDCLTVDNSKIFFSYLDILIARIVKNVKNNNFEYLHLLKNTLCFPYLKRIIAKEFAVRRCNFDNNIVIAPNGDIHHCNYTMGMKEDVLGNYKTGNLPKQIDFTVDDVSECKTCWAKYLCGGVCYYEKLINNQKIINLECYSRKEYIKRALHLYVVFYEMEKTAKILEILSN